MENKIAVITGATSGIGAAYAARLARDGYDLIITGRRKEKIEQLANKISDEQHVKVEVVIAELSNEEGIQRLVDIIKERNVEILVNNAGFGVSCLYQDCDLNIMEQMARVNILASMRLIHTVLPGMLERQKGTIINISSESAFLIIRKNSVYSGSKAFLKSFSEGLHMDLMNTGINVQVVCPGLTRTDFHQRMGIDITKKKDSGLINWLTPEDIVNASLKDLKKNKVICIPGINTRFLIRLLGLLPRKLYYQVSYNFSQKRFNKEVKQC